jgi:hypothetical protein
VAVPEDLAVPVTRVTDHDTPPCQPPLRAAPQCLRTWRVLISNIQKTPNTPLPSPLRRGVAVPGDLASAVSEHSEDANPPAKI